ncbi:MAG: hypothetical protein JNJ54_23020 [Myxococcaceae bacterium]|nr:hypothetical protein [Myxococcaceae bacterium]
MEVCPFCGTQVIPVEGVCPSCMGTLPTAKEPRRAKTSPALAEPPKKKLDLSDRSTDAQAPGVQALVMDETGDLHCAIHERAKARGSCSRCQRPACEICLSHGGVCPSCRREAAPPRITDLSRDVGVFTVLAGLAHFGFAAWQQLDRTVLDVDPRRTAVAVVLGVLHLSSGVAVWLRRRVLLGLVCTGVVAGGVIVPLFGGEPWWMGLVRLALSVLVLARTVSLKRQFDELYLPLDRPE